MVANSTDRDDDYEATVRNRLFVYYKQTAPLVGYFYAKGLHAEVDGSSRSKQCRRTCWR